VPSITTVSWSSSFCPARSIAPANGAVSDGRGRSSRDGAADLVVIMVVTSYPTPTQTSLRRDTRAVPGVARIETKLNGSGMLHASSAAVSLQL
jgi:hypothetical protein